MFGAVLRVYHKKERESFGMKEHKRLPQTLGLCCLNHLPLNVTDHIKALRILHQ